MRNKTIIKWVGIVVVLLLIQTVTQAALLLPKSSGCVWYGGDTFYGEAGTKAWVEYAVYDSTKAQFPSALTLPASIESGRYLYAYKIRNTSNAAIGTVQVIGKDVSNFKDIGAIADATNGIMPEDTANYDSATKTFTWEFAGGLFIVDELSAYLVFTSDFAPVEAKTVTFLTGMGDNPGLPGTESEVSESLENTIPEPATLALLSIGALTLRKKLRRRS